MGKFYSTKVIELGSTAFRQPKAESHCKFIHGYQLKAKIWFSCNELDENNWVFDFGGLKELKEDLKKTFDHKCVIAKDDPAKSAFKELERYNAVDLLIMDGVGIEKFSQFVFEKADVFVKYKTGNRVWVERVEVFEHEENSAIYEKINTEVSKEKATVTEIAAQPVQVKLEAPNQEAIKPANFGNNVTSGWSNPFGGTSWGV